MSRPNTESPRPVPFSSTLIFEQIEMARCGRCDSVIPQQHIRRVMDVSTGQQIITAYCEHCRIAWECIRTLRDGAWRLDSMMAVDHAQALKSIRAYVDRQEGNRQLKRKSA